MAGKTPQIKPARAGKVASPMTENQMECKNCGQEVECSHITGTLCSRCWVDSQQKDSRNG